MSGISETSIRERLQKITNTAQSIQTLSIWILHHQKKHADLILDIWLKEVRNNTDNERLINLIYLANDVIQNARRKAPAFMNAFYEVLQPAVSHITNTVDSSHRKKLERILDVWRERQIYKNEQLDVLAQALAESTISSPTNLNSDPESPTNYRGSPTSSSLKRPNSPITSPEIAKKIKEEFQAFSGLSNSMVTLLRRLEDPASADVKIRQLIAGYPENIANPSLLKQIKSREEVDVLENKICEAIPIVDQYCNRLKEELKDRHNLQYQMMDYAKALEQANERNKELVDSMRKRIARLDAEKKEMAKHIESLPDLSEIAGTTTLPPLGELFTSTR